LYLTWPPTSKFIAIFMCSKFENCDSERFGIRLQIRRTKSLDERVARRGPECPLRGGDKSSKAAQEKKRHFWCGQSNHHFEVIEQNDFSFYSAAHACKTGSTSSERNCSLNLFDLYFWHFHRSNKNTISTIEKWKGWTC
jgi:hypothetical protein